MKAWIYVQCLNYETKKDITDRFRDEHLREGGDKLIEYFSKDMTNMVNHYLCENIFVNPEMFDDEYAYEKCFSPGTTCDPNQRWNIYESIQKWTEIEGEYTPIKELVVEYPLSEAEFELHKGCVAKLFSEYVIEIAEEDLEVLECQHAEYDENYQRYLLIYHAKGNNYLKMHVTTFDDGRAECQIIKKGKTLIEVK